MENHPEKFAALMREQMESGKYEADLNRDYPVTGPLGAKEMKALGRK
jgi:hypothetical protein